MHARNDNNGGRRMRVLLKANRLTMDSNIYLILMICVGSTTHQCDKCIVCHAGVKQTSCLFHLFL